MMHGKGTFTWPNGRTYIGEYISDCKHGMGVFTWPDGSKHEGQWSKGVRHGSGSFTSSSGKVNKGEWQYGSLIGTETKGAAETDETFDRVVTTPTKKVNFCAKHDGSPSSSPEASRVPKHGVGLAALSEATDCEAGGLRTCTASRKVIPPAPATMDTGPPLPP